MRIVVVGAGYVGLSLATFLSRRHQTIIFDVDTNIINSVNNGQSHIEDAGLTTVLSENVKAGNLCAKSWDDDDIKNANYIILALPTNYDAAQERFDTTILDDVLLKISKISKDKNVVIKSTVPFGYTDKKNAALGLKNCFFSPEFLREGNALNDNLHPDRIIVGSKKKCALEFAKLMEEMSHERFVKTLYMSSAEAELVKLSANTYLAMRVAFFNEIDSFALKQKLSSDNIISGICSDKRIGEGYNNPSFGYGGYCLPKDVQQLSSTMKEHVSAATLIDAVHLSNQERFMNIVDHISKLKVNHVGIYRLQMKQGSDNYREAANYKIFQELIKFNHIKITIFEPDISIPEDCLKYLERDFEKFVTTNEIIVANRTSNRLLESQAKILTRDIYNEN